MSSVGGPTLVMSEFVETIACEEISDAIDSAEIKNVHLFPSDDREAMMTQLQKTLKSDIIEDINRMDVKMSMGTPLSDCAEEYRYPGGIAHSEMYLPQLHSNAEYMGDDVSELAVFQQRISQYEDITCLDQSGSDGRTYYIFEAPLGKKLMITMCLNSNMSRLVVINDTVCIDLEWFISINNMQYQPNGLLVCKSPISANVSISLQNVNIPLLIVAINKLAKTPMPHAHNA